MFSVGRFDPDAERHQQEAAIAARDAKIKEEKKARKRRSSNISKDDESNKNAKPKIKVIAPEQSVNTSKQSILEQTEKIEVLDDDMDPENEWRRDNNYNNESKKNYNRQRSTPETNEKKKKTIQSKKDDEIQRALQYSKMKIQEAAKLWNLAPFLVNNLEEDEYQNFFPIQALVIPDVIASERHVHIRTRDICVSAPTGSGKTLAFALPILNALSTRRIRRLRALVVLPGRDLATQVYNVFERYAKGSDLKVGLAIGQTDFEAEQKALIIGSADPALQTNNSLLYNALSDPDVALLQHEMQPLNVQSTMCAFGDVLSHSDRNDTSISTPISGRSAVDILICTPGRLMDHLEKTPAFTLQHLRFLVMDEADRLLNQSYQNWISRVLRATTSHLIASKNANLTITSHQVSPISTELKEATDGLSFIIDPITWRRTGSGNDTTNDFSSSALSLAASTCRPVQLRRLLFSATMTSDPQKLASLGLVNPKYFDAHHLNNAMNKSNASETPIPGDSDGANIPDQQQKNYSVPSGLSEHTIECTPEQKPLVLLALILEQRLLDSEKMTNAQTKGIVVVFTSSLESTHRLTRLLQLLWVRANYGSASSIVEFSSSLNQKQRKRLLQRCNNNNNNNTATTKSAATDKKDDSVAVVVCSDGMSRGMDISSVTAVINYDIPSYSKTYIHRCGRTARAGRKGRAITLLVKKGGQHSQFSKIRALIENPDRVQPMGVRQKLVEDAIPIYKSCIGALRRIIQAEQDGDLSPTDNQLIHKYIPRSQIQQQKRKDVSNEENTDDEMSSEGSDDDDDDDDDSSSLGSTDSSDNE